jgi:uncharacterized protein (UPF0332 family)
MNFIKTLICEGKIKLVESSKEIAESYAQKSENSLKAAKLLFQQNLLEESTSMSYYAMYHKVISIFSEIGIKCENHSGTIVLLKELFFIDTKNIEFAKKERIDKQYYTDFKITKEQTEDMIHIAENFCSLLEKYSATLNSKVRTELLQKFKELYL